MAQISSSGLPRFRPTVFITMYLSLAPNGQRYRRGKLMANQFNLHGKRTLITHADAFMGPMLCEVFAEHGATVIQSTAPLILDDEPAAIDLPPVCRTK